MPESNVSTEDSLGERIRMVASTAALGLLPIWLMLTVTIAQVHPEVQETVLQLDDQLSVTVERGELSKLMTTGWMSAAWIALSMVLVVPLVVAMSRWGDRGEVDSPDVLDDNLVADATWEVSLRRDGQAPSTSVPKDTPPLSDVLDALETNAPEEPVGAEPISVTPLRPMPARMPVDEEDDDTEETLDHLFE